MRTIVIKRPSRNRFLGSNRSTRVTIGSDDYMQRLKAHGIAMVDDGSTLTEVWEWFNSHRLHKEHSELYNDFVQAEIAYKARCKLV